MLLFWLSGPGRAFQGLAHFPRFPGLGVLGHPSWTLLVLLGCHPVRRPALLVLGAQPPLAIDLLLCGKRLFSSLRIDCRLLASLILHIRRRLPHAFLSYFRP